MKHELTYAIANYVAAAIAVEVARAGSFEYDNARAEERKRLETLDAVIAKVLSENASHD